MIKGYEKNMYFYKIKLTRCVSDFANGADDGHDRQ